MTAHDDTPDTTSEQDAPDQPKPDTGATGDEWSQMLEEWRGEGLNPKQVAERLKASRRWEERAKANADASRELDKLRKSQMTETEKAVDEAKASARADALREIGGRLVDAEVKAAAAGRLTEAQRDALLDGLDRTRFLTEDGDVDTARVAKWVDSIAPAPQATAEPDTTSRARIDLGQGRRSGQVRPSVAAGRDLYAQLRGDKTKTPS